MSEKLIWVNSDGGPLIVIPVEIAHYWRGCETGMPLTGDPETNRETIQAKTDYGRACGVDGYLGVLNVGDGTCLVLADDPMQTTIPPTNADALIVRWMYAKSEDQVLRAVRSVPEDIWEATPHRVSVYSSGLLLFDSSFPGDDLPSTWRDGMNAPWLKVPVPRGVYKVDFADYQPNDSTRLILHRLRRSCSEIESHGP